MLADLSVVSRLRPKIKNMSIDSVCFISLGKHRFLCPYTTLILITLRPNNDVRLATIKESPVLQREGFTENAFEKGEHHVPTMEGKYRCTLRGSLALNMSCCAQSGPLPSRNGNARRTKCAAIPSSKMLRFCQASRRGLTSDLLRTAS